MKLALIFAILSLAVMSVEMAGLSFHTDDALSKFDMQDAHKSIKQIVEDAGFLFEKHTVVTSDGYILTVFRIPGMKNETKTINANAAANTNGTNSTNSSTEKKPQFSDKPPIFMQHGWGDWAICWVIHRADLAPAFQAARAGYDVWLGNSRGTKESRRHEKYNPDTSKKYWEFSFVEMGLYDLPAVIEMIQEKTGGKQIAYVGYSMGTSEMFTALAIDSEWFADRLSIFVALGPVTKVSHTESGKYRAPAEHYKEVTKVLNLMGLRNEILGSHSTLAAYNKMFCGISASMCRIYEMLLYRNDEKLDDHARYAIWEAHAPGGSSVQSMKHYGQMIREDRFQVYSYDYPKTRHTREIPI